MELLHTFGRYIHVFFGFAGMAVFWDPRLAPKGRKLHVRFGRVFTWCAYVVTGSALLSCVLLVTDAIGKGVNLLEEPQQLGFVLFLAYLAVITFTSVRHAVAVLQHKKEPAAVGTLAHRALAWAAISCSGGVLFYAVVFWSPISLVLLALSPVGVLLGRDILRYIRRPPATKREWFYQHMGAMIGAGVAFHTAFAVFGFGRLFNIQPSGAWGIVPWILPVAIGIPGNIIWERAYRRKFGDTAKPTAPSVPSGEGARAR